MHKFMVVLLGFALFLGACAPVSQAETKWTNIDTGFWRIVDIEAGVVCWIYNNGISCMPLSQTKLDAGR